MPTPRDGIGSVSLLGKRHEVLQVRSSYLSLKKTMRSCNQCRKPVTNATQLCEACERYNAENEIQAKPTVSMTPVDTSDLAPVPYDSTVNVMLLSLGLCLGLMGLLIGVLCGSMTYALIGLGAGWLVALCLVPLFR